MNKIILTVVVLSMIFISCAKVDETNKRKTNNIKPSRFVMGILPPGAKDVKTISDKWVYFTLDGRRYLFFHEPYHVAITYLGNIKDFNND